jgi:hypothetical protein
MSTIPTRPSRAVGAVALVTGFLAALLWIFTAAILSGLHDSDPGGNAMARGFAALAIGALWLVLGVLALIAIVKGALPRWAKWAAVILVPASCAATFGALDLLSDPRRAPFLWPLVVPALLPPLVIALSWWALLPSLQRRVAIDLISAISCAVLLVVCASVIPFQYIRSLAYEREAQARAAYDKGLAAVSENARLWELTPFLARYLDDPVLERIRRLERRQSDAELMLVRGDFPLGYLGRVDLMPTPSICEKARALLRRQVTPLIPDAALSRPYSDVARQVAGALAAMKWLVGYDCGCDAESLAWETMAKAYRDPNFDVYELARLRDPKELGRILREYPEHFSMLSPKSHLKAWLRYADDNKLREQALAGAAKLDHRTADAVEMLNDKYEISGPWAVLKYLPVLDLQTSPALCAGGLKAIRDDLDKVLRPRADDPRPYSELLERLGAYRPLTALLWLGGHGCDAGAEATEAETVIHTYQPSAAGAAMLVSLAQLHRKQ